MIEIIHGDLFETDCDVICHQVNCQGVMGSGVAKQIKEKYPRAYKDYIHHIDVYNTQYLLGTNTITYCNDKRICNMFAQNNYGSNGRFTNYEAFYKCLENIRENICEVCTIAFPYKIGCDRGGGDWEIIFTMISQVLIDYTVKIYKLEE